MLRFGMLQRNARQAPASFGRRSVVSIIGAIFVLAVLAGCGLVSSESDSSLLIFSDVWSRPVAQVDDDGSNGVVYLTIENEAGGDDRLLAASTDVAEFTELHNSEVDDDGVMRMRMVDEVDIPEGETVLFEQGGYHLMLIDLHEPLEAGDSYDVVLEFDRAGEITVTAEVREP